MPPWSTAIHRPWSAAIHRRFRSLIPLKTLYSFIPAMAAAAGFSIGETPVRHRQRHGGKTSYGLLVFLWRPLVDLMGLAWYRRRCTLTPDDCRSAAARDGAR